MSVLYCAHTVTHACRGHTDAVLKALGSLESSEEKLAALCKKYADLLEENRVLQQKFKQSQKSLSVVRESRLAPYRAIVFIESCG